MYSVKEAAAILGKSESWIKTQAANGTLSAIRQKGYNNRTVWLIELHGQQSLVELEREWLGCMASGEWFARRYAAKTIQGHQLFVRWLWKWSRKEASLRNLTLET